MSGAVARRVIAPACVFVATTGLFVGCGQVPAPAQAIPLSVGWNEIAGAPYPENLLRPVTFWAGTELIVAAGIDFDETVRDVTHHTATYAYSPATGQWRDRAPLVVPGYDGLQALTGMWTGSAWLGIAQPCRDEHIEGEWPDVACDPIWVGVGWTLEGGWVISPDPLPPAAIQADWPFVHVAGLTSTSVILATMSGYLSHPLETGADWTFAAWPLGANHAEWGAACVIGNQIVTVSSVPGPESIPRSTVPDNVPRSLTANTLSLDGEVLRRQPLLDVQYGTRGPYCQQDHAIFIQAVSADPGVREPILRLTATEVVPLPTDTSSHEPPFYSPLDGGIDVGSGVLALDTTRTYFLDTVSGVRTSLQPVPNMHNTVWSGEVLYVNEQSTNRWFAFLPDGSWADSADLEFPFTIDGE